MDYTMCINYNPFVAILCIITCQIADYWNMNNKQNNTWFGLIMKTQFIIVGHTCNQKLCSNS